MAVLPGVPGIEVRILVNGLPTEEWPFKGNITREASEGDIKTDEHKAGPPGMEDARLPTRHSYIVSKSGCRFGVSLTLSSDLKTSSLPAMTGGIGIEIHIDGTFYSRFLVDLQNHEPQKRNYRPQIWNSARVKTQDGIIKREYPVFSDILSVEDRDNDKTEADMVRVKTMGTILLQFKNEDTDETDRKRPGGTILRYLGEFIYKYGAHSPEEPKEHELDSSVQAKMKYEEVKMPDGRSLVDLTGDDDE
ncbi:Uncharacterized protein LW93_4891 [Fusarium fujikuroi]|nr:Uncharacterized protein LW93_4891 [Fusarium fujikuroi]